MRRKITTAYSSPWDKMDKIGLEGVAAELKENGYAEESVEKYLKLFEEITGDVEGVRMCKEKLQGFSAG